MSALAAARAFVSGGDRTSRLGSGKPSTCIQIEPVGGSFEIANVSPTTVALYSAGTGSVDHIAAIPGSVQIDRDTDHDGVVELAACFAKEDLRALFSNVSGKDTVVVQVRGSLVGGAPGAGAFAASLALRVVGLAGPVAAAQVRRAGAAGEIVSFATSVVGAARPNDKFLPGDLLAISFDIEGAKADAAGKLQYSIGLEVADARGKVLRLEAGGALTRGRILVLK